MICCEGMCRLFQTRRTILWRQRHGSLVGLMLIAGLWLVLFGNGILAAAEPVAANGKALPGGATASLGSRAFRLGGWKKHLAFLDDETLLGSSEQGIKVWNRRTGEEVREIGPLNFEPQKIQLTADRRLVFASGFYFQREERRMVYVIQSLDVATGEEVHRFEVPHNAFLVTDDGSRLLVAQQSRISVYDLKSGEFLEELAGVGELASVLAVSPDGNRLALATDSNKVFLWDWREEGSQPVQISRTIRAIGLAFSPDGRWLAIGPDSRKELQLYDVAEKQVRKVSDADAPLYVESLAFSPDSRTLYAANAVSLSTEQQVSGVPCWDVRTGRLIRRHQMPHANPRTLTISPDGRLLAASDWDSGLHIWNLETSEVVSTGPEGHTSQINGIAFIPGTDRIVTISADETERVWEAATGAELRKTERTSGVWGVAVSHDGQLAATSAHDNEVRIWETADGEILHRLAGFGRLGGRHHLAFTRDGRRLVALGSSSPTLRVWNVATGEMEDELEIAPDDPDFRNNREPEMRMMSWRIKLGRDAATLTLATSRALFRYELSEVGELSRIELKFRLFDLDVSPDGKSVLTAEPNGPPEETQLAEGGIRFSTERNHALVLREAATGAETWRVPIAAGAYGPVRLSSDGTLAAVAIRGDKPRILILDAQTGESLHAIEGVTPSTGHTNGLAFSPDDRWLACVQQDATVLIWDVTQLLRRP